MDPIPPPKSRLRLLIFPSFLRRHRSAATSRLSASTRSIRTKLQYFQEVFQRFDANGDGKISADELRDLFACMEEDVGKEAMEGVIGDLDSDGDGMLDFGDFMSLMERGGDEELRRAFEMFEGHGGAITAKGVKRVLGKLLGEERTHEECEAMVRAYDLDGNGELSFGEFCKMMS